jgi:hypothetical protein
MARIRHRLEHSLILLDDYLHPLFGADPEEDRPFFSLKRRLGDVPEGHDSNGRSFLAQRLRQLYRRDPAELDTYDDNVKKHLDAINAARPQDEQITLKYFQLLSLLYTEHVLHRLFTDVDAFVAELNQLVAQRNERQRKDKFDDFAPDDLTKLAYWMATGSGKTLILHINYHQMRRYLALANQPPYDNILLITPNVGLSQQHLKECQLSGVPARIFRQSATQVLPGTVQIIDIHKFTGGATGPQTVNIAHFEGRNLVFVDEGHRGASGDVWFGYRDQLAADGFTFEYSATFGEALNSGNKPEDLAMRHAYGKAAVFDYSYRYFYGDGYGKDYTILNLPHSYSQDDCDTLLLANLLTLYEQTWVYRQYQAQMRDYHIEFPLLMFVGHTVQIGKKRLSKSDEESLSDVLDMVRFLHRVTSDRDWVVQTAGDILEGRSGLTDEHGVDIFLTKFPVLGGSFALDTLYDDLLLTIFQAPAAGTLHLANIRNAAGEISLRVGTSDVPFGVINIGDDASFLKVAGEQDVGPVIDPADALRGSLFDEINHTGSTVNILVGAKKFTEGWSSWRVSGMGLLNVGRSEGSEVIQMFGRGVRLKGYRRSLQRSAVLDGQHPRHLPLLETLNIFSVNGDYLAQFKQALGREGIIEGYEEIYLPVRFDTFDQEQPELYVIRTRQDLQFVDQPAFALVAEDNAQIKPEIDLSPRVQIATSIEATTTLHASRQEACISPTYLDILDWEAIYLEMLAWRRQRDFRNMTIQRQVLHDIMTVETNGGHPHSQYYTLFAPDDLIAPPTFADLPRLQAIVVAILKRYAERFYNHRRQQWESKNLEYRLLDKNDPNMLPATLPLDPPQAGYVIKVNRDKPDLIDEVENLVQQGQALYQQDQDNFPNIVFDRHLYIPLVAQGYYDTNTYTFTEAEDIKSVPVGLNEGEARFVRRLRHHLTTLAAAQLGDRKLYLLRNLSRGKGIGFFEARNFYPDFILWVVDGTRQSITFIDPKGLAMLRPNDFSNPKIQLHQILQAEIAPRPNNPNITLDSYIISAESYEETVRYFGDPNNPFSRDQFAAHHVLFPSFAAEQLLDALLQALQS